MKKPDNKKGNNLFGPLSKRAVCIYGPPEMLMKKKREAEEKKDSDIDENIEDGFPTPIYGPPEVLRKKRSEKVDIDVPEDIYGPPEMLGAIDNNENDEIDIPVPDESEVSTAEEDEL